MTVELFGENNSLPQDFKEIIGKARDKGTIEKNEYLFFALLYNLWEIGFVPLHLNFRTHVSTGYSKIVFCEIKRMSLNSIYDIVNVSNYISYTAKLRIGPESNPEVFVMGLPSVKSEKEYFTVSCYVKEPNYIKSHCFLIGEFFEMGPHRPITMKNTMKFARLVRDQIGLPIKQPMLLDSMGCVPHLLGIPDHLFDKIRSYLSPSTLKLLHKACGIQGYGEIILNCALKSLFDWECFEH